MNKLNILLCALAFIPATLLAQTYEKLTPYSEYSCITLSTGDTYVGKVTDSGYSNVPFEDLKKSFKKQITVNERKIDRYKDLLGAIADEETTSAKKFLEAIEDLRTFYKGEKDTPPPPKTRKEKIEILKKAISADKTFQKGFNAQIKALQDCKEHKIKDKPGFITPQLIIYGGFAGRFLVGTAEKYSGYYCVKGPKGFQVLPFTVLPCAGVLPECSEKDGTYKVGIALCTTQADHPFSEEEKIIYTQYLEETCGGSFEIKPAPVKNGEYTPCNVVFGE